MIIITTCQLLACSSFVCVIGASLLRVGQSLREEEKI